MKPFENIFRNRKRVLKKDVNSKEETKHFE